MLDLPYDRLPIEICELHAVRCNDRKVAISEKEKIAGVIENGGHVGSYEILIFPQTDNRRRTVAGGYDFVRLIHRDHCQRKHTA